MVTIVLMMGTVYVMYLGINEITELVSSIIADNVILADLNMIIL